MKTQTNPETISSWLSSLPGVHDAIAGTVRIDGETFPAVRYKQTTAISPGCPAYDRGERETTRESIYCAGLRPKRMNFKTLLKMDSIVTLIHHIRERGPVPAVRVSSTHARGAARAYSYWGVAEYEISLDASGFPSARCKRAARSARRSIRLAGLDAQETGLPVIRSIGSLTAGDVETVVAYLEETGVVPA